MVEENGFLDALNDCADRLGAGEPLDVCLHKYPQYEAQLRRLLPIGHAVQQAATMEIEAARAQAQTREQLFQKLATHRTSLRRRWLLPLALVAASLLMFFGIAGLLKGSLDEAFQVMSEDTELPATRVLLLNITGGATLPQALATPTLLGTMSLPDASPTPEATNLAGTATPLPAVATSVARMSPEPSGTQVAMLLTARLPLPTPLPSQGAPTFVPQTMTLSAGAIDDNARWETYLEYRRNYLSSYPGTVHDVDVNGRQLIRVLDADGDPVLGAHVDVYAGQSLVSTTHTYSEGRTPFLPHANGQ